MESALADKEALLLDLLWLEGDWRKACEKVTHFIDTSPDLEWKKQNVYCLYLGGEKERAKIAAELLGEVNSAAVKPLNGLFDATAREAFGRFVASLSSPLSPFLLTVWLEGQETLSESDLDTLSCLPDACCEV